MLRRVIKSVAKNPRSFEQTARTSGLRSMATQSGDNAERATVLAKLHLEDGTTLIGKSFGCHESAEGEVRRSKLFLALKLNHI